MRAEPIECIAQARPQDLAGIVSAPGQRQRFGQRAAPQGLHVVQSRSAWRTASTNAASSSVCCVRDRRVRERHRPVFAVGPCGGRLEAPVMHEGAVSFARPPRSRPVVVRAK
jgi:hypothetical protein